MSSNNILIGGSLIPNATNKPLDARYHVATLNDVSSIKLPHVGMLFYCLADEIVYIVKSLKSATVGEATIPNYMIDSYEYFSQRKEYSILNVRIPDDADGDNLTCYIELSSSMTFTTDLITLNSIADKSIMSIGYDGEFMAIENTIPPYCYSGMLIIDLTQLESFNNSTPYYARCRWFDGNAYTAWSCLKFYQTGVMELPNANVTEVSESAENENSNSAVESLNTEEKSAIALLLKPASDGDLFQYKAIRTVTSPNTVLWVEPKRTDDLSNFVSNSDFEFSFGSGAYALGDEINFMGTSNSYMTLESICDSAGGIGESICNIIRFEVIFDEINNEMEILRFSDSVILKYYTGYKNISFESVSVQGDGVGLQANQPYTVEIKYTDYHALGLPDDESSESNASLTIDIYNKNGDSICEVTPSLAYTNGITILKETDAKVTYIGVDKCINDNDFTGVYDLEAGYYPANIDYIIERYSNNAGNVTKYKSGYIEMEGKQEPTGNTATREITYPVELTRVCSSNVNVQLEPISHTHPSNGPDNWMTDWPYLELANWPAETWTNNVANKAISCTILTGSEKMKVHLDAETEDLPYIHLWWKVTGYQDLD